MDDVLASMWSTLSLTENESITLQIDPNKLSVPKFVIIGKLAMKKYVNLFDVDKGLKSIWNVAKELESTQVGDNLYLFTFKNESTLERVMKNQPWNFRGSLLILNRTIGDVYPTDLILQKVPFWVQIHGHQLSAMNRAIGEAIGALMGDVIEFAGDEKGIAIGRCI